MLRQHTACSDNQMSSQQVGSSSVYTSTCLRQSSVEMNLDRVNKQNMQARMITRN